MRENFGFSGGGQTLESESVRPDLEQENKETFFEEAIGMVEKTYEDRLAKQSEGAKTQILLKDNLDHVRQVTDNVDFIVNEIKAGRMSDKILAKNESGQVEVDEKLLKTMAVFHDIAKIDENGKLDTFHHHERSKVENILIKEDSPVHQFLKAKGFDDEEISLMVDGIESHSRRTDFIYRYFYNKNKQELTSLPSPEGILEYVILSDADILTQSKLEQGVKKIICSRLINEGFRKEDTVDGRHSIIKTLASVIDSAQKVKDSMHFELTKQKASGQLGEVEEFEKWLTTNNKIQEIDVIEDFGQKKKRFDELINEFLALNSNQ